jgi:hypothetical protein
MYTHTHIHLNSKKSGNVKKMTHFFHFCHGLKMAFRNRLALFDGMSVYK